MKIYSNMGQSRPVFKVYVFVDLTIEWQALLLYTDFEKANKAIARLLRNASWLVLLLPKAI